MHHKQYWMDYIRWVANNLMLRDWTFIITDEPPSNPDAQATICITFGRKIAGIYLHWNWHNFEPEQQRQTIVHELLHCHFDVIQQSVDRATEMHQKDWMRILQDFHLREIEWTVDAMADIIAPFLALPEPPRNDAPEYTERETTAGALDPDLPVA